MAHSSRVKNATSLFLCFIFSIALFQLQQIPSAAQSVNSAQTAQYEKDLATADKQISDARASKDESSLVGGLHARGRSLRLMGKLKEASETFLEAVDIWKHLNSISGQARALAAAGIALAKLEPSRSEKLVNQAIQMAESDNSNPIEVSQMLHNLGLTAEEQRLPALSRTFWLRALAIREKSMPGSLDLAWTYFNLGNVALGNHEFKLASDYYNKSLLIRQKQIPVSAETAWCLFHLGTTYFNLEDLTQSADYYRQSLVIREKLNDLPGSARICVFLAHMAYSKGDMPTSQLYNERALAIYEQTDPMGPGMRSALIMKSTILLARGQYHEAEEVLKRDMAMETPGSQTMSQALAGLASVSAALGTDQAYQATLAQSEETIRRPPVDDAALLHLLKAQSYYALRRRDFPSADAKLRELIEVAERMHYDTVYIQPDRLDYAYVLDHQGHPEEANAIVAKSLDDIRKRLPDSIQLAYCAWRVGEILFQRGNYVGAEPYYQEAWNIAQRQVDMLPSDQARFGMAEGMLSYYFYLFRVQVWNKNPEAAFFTLEQSRAQALRKLMVERKLFVGEQPNSQMELYRLAAIHRSVAAAAVSAALVAESEARSSLSRAQASPKSGPVGQPGAAVPGNVQAGDSVESAQAALNEATKKLGDARVAYRQAHVDADKAWENVQKTDKRIFTETLTLEQARKALPPGVVYISFCCDGNAAWCFMAESTGPLRVYGASGNLRDLTEQIESFRQLVSSRNSDVNVIATQGRALFKTLFPPETHAQLARATHLVIAPDGPLWDLPFAALVTNDTGAPTYLGLQKPMAFTQSLNIYALFGVQAVQSKDALAATAHKQVALVIGDPVFDRNGTAADEKGKPLERSYLWGGKLPPARLPNTRTEAVKIASLYGGSPLLGEDATEASLRRKLESADVIHLATHGYMNPDNPMASGLLLTVPLKTAATLEAKGVKPTSNDGALQAWEIFSQLHLHADLAVLSACDTGMGKKVHGEGVIGLTRALQYAGVRSIVASQWKVGDASTSDLMVAFHTKRQSGQAKDEALRQAMQSVQAQKETAHPYHWASFFLTGDPGKSTVGAAKK